MLKDEREFMGHPGNRKGKILVVDDEQSMREHLATLFRNAGYAVTLAEGGREALESLRCEIFDLVIADVQMPKEGGIEVLRRIKEISPRTPVLMVTAYSGEEYNMALTEKILQHLSNLPESLQGEVLDYVEYLESKVEQSREGKEEIEWETLSLSFALRGMEEEYSPYSLDDLREHFS